MRVFIFGDSIVQGFYDDKSGGWANQLHVQYQKKAIAHLGGETTDVFNLGISGDTAEGVRSRLTDEVIARRLYEDNDCIIIAVGINDAILINNRVVCEVYDFQAAYEEIIDEALKLTPRVICVGLTAVKESETDPWPYSNQGKQWKNNRINLFEDTIKQSAENKEVPFVPIHDEFLKLLGKKQLLADALHPNHAGHAFIAREVLAAIEALR